VPALWQESPLAPLVDVAVFSCSERIKKPDPRIYEHACERLGVRPQDCLYVGDGGSDELRGATAVGMRAIQIRPGDTEPYAWDGPVVSRLHEVAALVG
jgi:putative hydrolase of the HAD superfamily